MSAVQTETAAAPPRGDGSRRSALLASRWPTVAVLVLTLVPVLALVAYHLVNLHGGYVASDDRAVTEMRVRDIGHHSPLVGPYSREPFDHPGPALFYLIWPLYELFGHADAALPVTALLVNGAAIVGIALVVRRRAGFASMVWTLLVLAVYLRFLEAGFVGDVWNPMLPVLPFALMVLLCWTFVLGDAWALPVALGLGSFCVESHVGYSAGVLAVLAVTAVGLAVRWRRGRVRNPLGGARGPRVRKVLAASVGVLAVLWVLPVYQQLRDQPGNLGEIVNYFRHTAPDNTYHTGVRQLLTQLGKPIGYVTGQRPYQEPSFLVPSTLPVWTGVLALLLAAGAVVLAWRRRQAAVLWLAAFAGVLTLAGVVAVRRVVGPVYEYLVLWTVVAGLLTWIVIGAAVLAPRPVAAAPYPTEGAADEPVAAEPLPAGGAADDAAVTEADPPAPVDRPARGLRVVAGGLALVALAVLTGITTDASARHAPGTEPAMRPLADAVVQWLGPRRNQVVSVHYGGPPADNLKTVFVGSGLILQLQKRGVDAQGPKLFEKALGVRTTERADSGPLVVTFGYLDAVAPKGQHFLARSGELQVFVGTQKIPVF